MSDGIKLHEKIGPLYRGVFPLRFSDDAIGVLFAVIDAVSITAASLVSSLLYNAFAYSEAAGGVPVQTDVFFGIGIVAAILYLFVAKSWGLYGFAILVGFNRPWGRLVASWILVVLLLVLFLFLLKIGAFFFARHHARLCGAGAGLRDRRACRCGAISSRRLRARRDGRPSRRGDRRPRPARRVDEPRSREALRHHRARTRHPASRRN